MRADDPAIEELIEREQFHRFPGTNVTVCVLSMKCGQEVVAYSIGAGRTEFDLKTGQDKARHVAMSRIAGLETYRQRMENSQ